MARRAVQQELSRERILKEAQDQFLSNGYHAVTMRSIAKGLGYSHGALYYHFKEKAELFSFIVNRDFNQLLSYEYEILKNVPKGKMTINDLQKMMKEFACFCIRHAHSYEMMFVMRDLELKKYSRNKQKQLIEFFMTVVKSLKPQLETDLYAITKSLLISLHGFISYHIHFKQPYEQVCQFAEKHIDQICRGILSYSMPDDAMEDEDGYQLLSH